MNDIKNLLQNAIGRSNVTAGQSDKSDPLEFELKRLRSRNELYFIILYLLVTAFFVSSSVIIFLRLDKPELHQAIFAVLGGTVFGSLVFLRNLWRRKIALDIVLATFTSMLPEERRLFFEKLLKTI